ncbi:hypothetical protein EF912_37380 [Streptomyces sp. WAC07061]|uniref:hypothetical protein n=1 Tax=Streptomyces sp. WAC07061 TaxID=2487410 RepID=UPI000F79CE8E|nr:hypothetical protein [Streptomyces sp. WAC07061]RSS33593.1 hypothetical protein EF912_37380 [Streptomyces sp. WAC07061]
MDNTAEVAGPFLAAAPLARTDPGRLPVADGAAFLVSARLVACVGSLGIPPTDGAPGAGPTPLLVRNVRQPTE